MKIVTVLDTHAHTVYFLWTSNQHVSETATYTTLNKHKSRISMSTVEFEPAIPAMKQA